MASVESGATFSKTAFTAEDGFLLASVRQPRVRSDAAFRRFKPSGARTSRPRGATVEPPAQPRGRAPSGEARRPWVDTNTAVSSKAMLADTVFDRDRDRGTANTCDLTTPT